MFSLLSSLVLATLAMSTSASVFSEVAAEVGRGAKTLENGSERHKVFLSLNPSCNVPACSINSSLTVANLSVISTSDSTSDSSNDREHHWIWSVIERPAVQAALTQPGARAKINWAALLGMGDLDSSITYDVLPDYSAAIMLANLIEFDDVLNEGYLDESNQQVIVYPVAHFQWKRRILENSTERVAIAFVGENFTSTASTKYNVTGGKLNITLSAYSYDGFGVWLPHLSISESTNQIDIQLDNLATNSGFNNSRFALEFVFVSNAQKRIEPYRQCTRTLDDEHTPGIFRTHELVIPGYNDTLQAYLQWRPVVYTSSERDLSSSTDVNVSSPVTVATPNVVLNTTILYAFYGEDLQDMTVKRINVSLGAKGDGFYNKTRFQAWTFTLGTGVPIHNGMSPLLILAMTIMFLVLCLVLISACVACAIRKFRRQNVIYQSI